MHKKRNKLQIASYYKILHCILDKWINYYSDGNCAYKKLVGRKEYLNSKDYPST
jgi:hypothetical protein